jgi:ubiquinone/menaquinone biosynthesis C-methylase UbiE
MQSTHKPYKGPAMEGFIATWYARITGGDPSFVTTADELAREQSLGARVLEVAPGPGYLSIELARRGFRVTGVDISRSFVRIASENARAAQVEVTFREGNASALPFPDQSFDYVVCRAAFKNFTDPLGALDEAHRVLVPGSRASIIDLRKEATLGEISAEVARMHMSRLNAAWTRWTFRSFLLKNAYSSEAMRELVAKSRFRVGTIAREGVGFHLRLQRERVPNT